MSIIDDLLNDLPNTYDKREGSFFYDALKPVAEQLEALDADIDIVKKMFLVSNLNGTDLETRVYDITGLSRKIATYATGTVTITGTGTIISGDLFETSGGVQFEATEIKAITNSGTVNIQAVIAGDIGNVASGAITLFPITITGFTAVTNANATTGGYYAESDADLLARYYDKLQTPATSGNKAQYRQWAIGVSGVGDAKILPLWNGINTVKVVIIDSNKEVASSELVETVQEYIDPSSSGLGDGAAPLGAYCTVVSATQKIINVSVALTLQDGYTTEQVQPLVEESLTNYLRNIAFNADIVSIALVGANILNTEGVMDYANLLINSSTGNVTIGNDEVAMLGTVTISV